MLKKVKPAYFKLVLVTHSDLTVSRRFIEDLVDSFALVETETYTGLPPSAR